MNEKRVDQKVTIRLLEKGDEQAYFDLIDNNRGRLKRYFPITTAQIEVRKDVNNYVKNKVRQAFEKTQYVFVILVKQQLAGALIVKNIDWRVPKAELAYFIDRQYEGQGVMSAGMSLLLSYCFEQLRMNKLYICASTENEASQRVAISAGFHLEGILRSEFRVTRGGLEDICYFGLLQKEWHDRA